MEGIKAVTGRRALQSSIINTKKEHLTEIFLLKVSFYVLVTKPFLYSDKPQEESIKYNVEFYICMGICIW